MLHQIADPKTTQTVTLTAGQNYNVRVYAYGSSCHRFSESRTILDFTATASTTFRPNTPTATATISPLRPHTPVNLKVVVNSAGNGATVTWESGGSGVGGSCPDARYDFSRVDYDGIETSIPGVVYADSGDLSKAITGLTSGESYTIKVTAYGGSSCRAFSIPAMLEFTATASETVSAPTNTPTPTATNTPAPTDTPTGQIHERDSRDIRHHKASTPTATDTPRPTNKATAVAAARATESAAWKDLTAQCTHQMTTGKHKKH